MHLERFEHQGLELVINTQTGECFASQSAIARMVGKEKADGGIRRFLANFESKSTEIPTTGGLRQSQVFSEHAIYQAFLKYRPELLVKCAEAGIRLYLHKLAGYKFVSVQSDSAMLAKILTLVEQQAVRIENLERISAEAVRELKGVRVVLDELSGLDEIMERLKTTMYQPNQQRFTLKEILKQLGFDWLSRGARTKIGRQLTEWLKINEMQLPEKKGNNTLYKECYKPLIEFAVEQIR